MDRRQRLLGSLDIARLEGLEIGARQAPLIAKSEGRVAYVDYTTTEEMRRAWDKADKADPACFVDVDLVWGRDPLPVVDYVVASHVVEHVPDLAGWLLTLRQTLRPGGVLCLAVPDRRFTFDVLRAESSLSDAVEAHLAGFVRPSPRQVFDSYAFTRPNDHREAWRSDPTARLRPIAEKRESALAKARQALTTYVDSHCWVFTPRSFLTLMRGLRGFGWFPYAIDAFQPTERDDLEFMVRLRAEDEPAAVDASFEAAEAALAAAPAPPEEIARQRLGADAAWA